MFCNVQCAQCLYSWETCLLYILFQCDVLPQEYIDVNSWLKFLCKAAGNRYDIYISENEN